MQNRYIGLQSSPLLYVTLPFSLCPAIASRSRQMCSKQFCLWDLAPIIYIAFIIQIVWAI